RLTGFRPEHTVDPRMQEASINEDLLQFAALVLAQVHSHRDRCRPAETRSRSSGYDIDDPVAAVHDNDFILDDEEAVVTEEWEKLDQYREGRHRDDAHVRR